MECLACACGTYLLLSSAFAFPNPVVYLFAVVFPLCVYSITEGCPSMCLLLFLARSFVFQLRKMSLLFVRSCFWSLHSFPNCRRFPFYWFAFGLPLYLSPLTKRAPFVLFAVVFLLYSFAISESAPFIFCNFLFVFSVLFRFQFLEISYFSFPFIFSVFIRFRFLKVSHVFVFLCFRRLW